jgi:exodeoxyribonuclease V alpha subunit
VALGSNPQAGQPASTSTATEVLGGLVERVTFHNEGNGFCVLRVKARGQRDLITVLGHAAMISAGEFVQARPQALEA